MRLPSNTARPTDGTSSSSGCHAYVLLSNIFTICSNVLPLVSGAKNRKKKNASTPMTAKMKNGPARPVASARERNDMATAPDATRFTAVPMPMACARNRSGKISDVSSQLMGPRPMEKKATNTQTLEMARAEAPVEVVSGAGAAELRTAEGDEAGRRRKAQPRPTRAIVIPRERGE